MVHESVLEDLVNTLIACRWLSGTTTRPVNNPANGLFEVVTVEPDDVFALVVDDPISVINFFPDPTSGPPEINTLAIDMPRPADPEALEMGSTLQSQPYKLTLAFYADSDAVAQSMMSDLGDRYAGRIVDGQAIPLFNYLGDDPDEPIALMEVEAFRFARDVDTANVTERTTWFGELELSDVQ